MINWQQYVTDHLQLNGLTAGRERQIVDELAQQLEDAYREARARGLSEEEAQDAARRHIANWQVLRRELESTRRGALPRSAQWQERATVAAASRRWWSPFAALFRDLLFAARMMRKAPGYTVVAVLTLSLGIGANVAVFSVIESTVLRPLPFRNPGQLVAIATPTKAGAGSQSASNSYGVSVPDFEDIRQGQSTFQAMSMWISQSVNFSGREHPDRVIGSFVSAGFFDMMEVKPLLGRTFVPGEDKPGAAPVVMLDYRAWQTQFGGSPEILGTAMTLNGESYTVIGVLPSWFSFPWGESDVWMTIPHYPNYRWDRNFRGQAMIGRIRDGVTREQAAADLQRIVQRLSREFHQGADVHVVLQRLKDLQVNDIRPVVMVLSSAVLLILLIACANLGSVLLARGAARAHEVAIRMALGAGRHPAVGGATDSAPGSPPAADRRNPGPDWGAGGARLAAQHAVRRQRRRSPGAGRGGRLDCRCRAAGHLDSGSPRGASRSAGSAAHGVARPSCGGKSSWPERSPSPAWRACAASCAAGSACDGNPSRARILRGSRGRTMREPPRRTAM